MRLLFSTAVLACLAGPAFAQDVVPHSAEGIRGGAPAAPAPRHTVEPGPSAVPGAVSRGGAAPATAGAADLPPTEALFDAINRGDIVTARDAISRGADLDSANVLGLTPLELSVDLGRNDISFLLLSERSGPDGASGNGGPPQSAPPPSPAQRRQIEAQARAEARAEARAAARGQSRSQAAARRIPASPAQPGPALFAGDGGAPLPSAGFLGFTPHR